MPSGKDILIAAKALFSASYTFLSASSIPLNPVISNNNRFLIARIGSYEIMHDKSSFINSIIVQTNDTAR
ncbi:hypothetical protein HanIR_Chr06g0272111 [Helianthus annuus]|nr:hypothetical protein HanIR_Chr06g0272111 [Helianthus annuus]